jgi:hypothetical protein
LKLLKLRSEDEETWKKKLELADEVSTDKNVAPTLEH